VDDIVVAAAQCVSVRDNLDENISRHLKFVEIAASVGANLLVFPELSLTGYELDLASGLQLNADDPRMGPLRNAAESNNMHILVGGPMASGMDKPFLGAFLLSPEASIGYAKIHVHGSEQEYFASGREGCIVPIAGVLTAIAICADTSHPSHAADAARQDAELYVASVMKTGAEYQTHADRLQQYASRHRMAVLTANYAGSTGGSDSAGRSAIWDEHGRNIAEARLNGENLVVARRSNNTWSGEVISKP